MTTAAIKTPEGQTTNISLFLFLKAPITQWWYNLQNKYDMESEHFIVHSPSFTSASVPPQMLRIIVKVFDS